MLKCRMQATVMVNKAHRIARQTVDTVRYRVMNAVIHCQNQQCCVLRQVS